MKARLPPLILEHIMPIFFFELIFFRRLRKFREAAQFCQVHWDSVRREVRVFIDRANSIEAVTIRTKIEHLYPILDELLDDWKAHVRLPYEGIRIAGTLWSLSSHEVKDFLTRHQIPYQWLDIEKDSNARKLVEDVSSSTKLPILFFPDGTNLI